jgi:hypothetical protein
VLDVEVEGGEPVMTKSGHARYLDRQRGSQRDLQWLGVAMQVGYADAAAVLKVGEEETGGVTKTMGGRRHPAPREVAWWKPLAASSRGDGADRVQRCYGLMGQRSCKARVGGTA